MRYLQRRTEISAGFPTAQAFAPSLCSPQLHRGTDGLFLFGVDLGSLKIGLPVHPLVQTRTLKTPTIAQFERGHKPLRSVLVQRVGRYTRSEEHTSELQSLRH